MFLEFLSNVLTNRRIAAAQDASDGREPGMAALVAGKRSRGGGGAAGRAGRGGAAAGAAAAAAAAAGEADLKMPRGSRETAMLLRDNGYAVLNKEKLRRHGPAPPSTQQHAQPAVADQQQGPDRQQRQQQRAQPRQRPSQKQQEQQQQQDQQQQERQPRRQVRLVEPAPSERQQQQQQPARRAGEKRKHASQAPSASEDEEDHGTSHRSMRSQQLVQQPAQSQQQGGMKRVRSSWKMRPLLIDEKLAVFLEGQDESLLHYDGGEFYQWLKDCEAGLADPADGFPYPLVVQDKELRTLLEIKPPDQEPAGDLRLAAVATAAAATAAAAAAGAAPAGAAAAASGGTAGASGAGIIVPVVRTLSHGEQPDELVRQHNPPVVQRLVQEEGLDVPDVAGTSAAARAASAAWRSAERAVALDPPYIRYVQPTPDDLDLAVEYDLDEEDEEWLERFNTEAKRAKSRKARRTLGEEWMEHLIDRMEKEYTAELQRHPGRWVVQAADPSASDQLPAVSLPSIEEVFPLEKCLQVPGINHYQNVIAAVYAYWRAKHQRAGRPLIQRLWYEPPWDRRKAARLAGSGADGGDGEGGEGEEGPFHGQDSPVALAGIRKRRMDPEEAKARFQEIRRDLESARTLADQVRKREKLKKRELQLYKEEWAARMQAVRDCAERVVLQQGRVKDPPAQLSAVWRLEAAGVVGWGAAPASSGEGNEEDQLLVGAPQDAAAQAEERAARLAMRRFARDVGPAGMQVQQQQQQQQQAPQRQQQQAQQQQQQQAARRRVGRPRGSTAAAASHRRAEHAAMQQQRAGRGGSPPALKHAGNVRGPAPPPGVRRVPVCVWCRSGEFLLLGCASCPRCFCFKCFQRRPGLGINNWSRAVKDSRYRCVICRGLEAEDAPSANTTNAALAAADAADATSPLPGGRRPAQQQRQHLTAARLEAERLAERLGVEVPRGLGGAALRSFLRRLERELEEEAEEEEEEEQPGAAEASEHSQEEEEEVQQPRDGHGRHRPARAPVAQRRRGVAAAAGHSSSSEGELGGGEDEEEQRRPKQRKLGGAALASHLKRLEQRRAERGVRQGGGGGGGGSDDERQPSSSGGGAAGEAEVEEEEAWPHPHIPPPPRKLGGAALRSYVRRQEELLAAEEAEGGGGSAGEGSGHAAGSDREDGAWPHPHIPPPSRKLGGAALRSYIKRQEELLAADEAGEAASGDDDEQGGASDSGEESWPYTHIPPPTRKLGGAALRSYIKRQEALLEEAEEEAAGGRHQQQHEQHHHAHPQRSGSSSGTAEKFDGSSGDDAAGGGGSSSSGDDEDDEEEEGQSELKENRAPPAKRPRKGLGGAALASHLRKVAAAAEASAAAAGRYAGGRRSAAGHAPAHNGRRVGREARR